MDYDLLLSLRTALTNLFQCPDLDAPSSQKTTTAIRAARDTASRVNTTHLIRELHILPPRLNRLHVLRLLGDRQTAADARFRRAVLASRDLLRIPQNTSNPKASAFKHAIAQLIVAWRTALDRCKEPSIHLELDALSVKYTQFVRRVQDQIQQQHTQHHATTQTDPPPQLTSNSLPHFVDQFDQHNQSISNLQRQIDDALAILDETGIQELKAGGHDGIHELVSSIWAQLRSQFNALKTLASQTQRMAALSVDAITKLRAADLLADVNAATSALHLRHTTLYNLGFELSDLSSEYPAGRPGPSAAIPHDSDSSSSDDEDEWEDAVEIEPNVTEQPGQAQGETETESSAKEPALPPVNDWVSVMRGKEDVDANKIILERFERQAANANASASNQDGAGASNALADALNRVGGRGRGRPLQQGQVKSERGKGVTARKRLSTKLGIRKKKNKLTLD